MELPACSSTDHSHIAHQIRIAQQAQTSCDVKIGNLQDLKVGSDVLLDNFLNILDRKNESEMYAVCMQLKTVDQAIDIIQGDFYDRYYLYTDSCAISHSAFLFQ